LVDFPPDFVAGTGLVNVNLAETQIAGSIHGNSLNQITAGRRRNVNGWNAQFFKRNGYDAGRRRCTHVTQSHHGSDGLLFGQHGGIFLQSCGILSADRFHVINKIADSHFAKAFLDTDKHFAIVAEAEFRVVVEEDFAPFEFFNADSRRQLDDRPILESPGIQQWIELLIHWSYTPQSGNQLIYRLTAATLSHR